REVAAEEIRIASIATGSNAAVEPPVRRPGRDRSAAAASILAALLRLHEATVAAYQASLQSEYEFYVVAAQTPAVRAAVTTVAAASAPVSAVVSYDLQLVSTQLQQEQAIAAAAAASAAQAQQEIVATAGAPTFTAPVGGVVTQGFGATSLAMEPSMVYHGVFYTHFHTGIDIANVLDTPVVAAAPGRVMLAASSRDAAGNLVGYGNYVVIDHGGGYLTLYGHLDKFVVTAGQLVQRGQEIGLLGSTGWSTGPHVHFEIRHDGDYVNPEPLLGAAVRP
ncbi:MAG: M23 family metallopeptidase, partial [Solirubrobacteraceae bacterium]